MTELHRIAKEAGFVPDVIPPDCRVPLVQENFPEHEVLFVANYFMYYVKRYKWANSHGGIGKAYEKWLDFWFTGPLTPRKLLVFLYDKQNNTKRKLNTYLKDHHPDFYLSLRNKRLQKKIQK